MRTVRCTNGRWNGTFNTERRTRRAARHCTTASDKLRHWGVVSHRRCAIGLTCSQSRQATRPTSARIRACNSAVLDTGSSAHPRARATTTHNALAVARLNARRRDGPGAGNGGSDTGGAGLPAARASAAATAAVALASVAAKDVARAVGAMLDGTAAWALSGAPGPPALPSPREAARPSNSCCAAWQHAARIVAAIARCAASPRGGLPGVGAQPLTSVCKVDATGRTPSIAAAAGQSCTQVGRERVAIEKHPHTQQQTFTPTSSSAC